jgi:hypothetical protein
VLRSTKVGVVEKKIDELRNDFIARDAKTSSEVTCDTAASDDGTSVPWVTVMTIVP